MGPSRVRGHRAPAGRRTQGRDGRCHCNHTPPRALNTSARRGGSRVWRAGLSRRRSAPAGASPVGAQMASPSSRRKRASCSCAASATLPTRPGARTARRNPCGSGQSAPAARTIAVGSHEHRAIAQLAGPDEGGRRRVRHHAIVERPLDEHPGRLESGERRPPQMPGVRHRVRAPAQPLDSREVLLDREGARRGRDDGPIPAKRKILAEIPGQVQQRRAPAKERVADQRPERGREARDLGDGPARDVQDADPHPRLDRQEDRPVDPAERLSRVGDRPQARVVDAVAVHVQPSTDRSHERHEIDHLLAQAVAEAQRGERPAVERGRPSVGSMRPSASRSTPRPGTRTVWHPPVGELDEEPALRPAAVADHRDRHRRDPVARQAARDEQRARRASRRRSRDRTPPGASPPAAAGPPG